MESYDGGGKHSVDGYDFKGLPLHSYQQLLEDASLADADWTTGAAPALNTEVFTTTAVIDALGRPVTITIRDDDAGILEVTRHQYDKGGLLKEVYHKEGIKAEAIYVQDIHYDAKGQRQAIWYGNGTKTRYTYDPKTYRLTRLFTVNVDSSNIHYNEVYQDLNYWYDAVGNITRIRDDAQAVLFYGNSIIEPVKKYTYDALYRLIHAEGREQTGSNSFDVTDNYADAGNIVSSSNPSAVQNYVQTYEYDGVGNITTLVHSATSKSYTRTFTYGADSNRLLQSDVVTSVTTPYTYSYDARGNMLSMPHLQTMDWNQENQLSHLVAGTTQAFYQYSGGQRVRKVVVNSGITEERIYLGSLEIYRKFDSTSSLTLERTTVHISDDTGRIAMLETRTFGTDASEAELKRFVYSNHLQSASLELDGNGDIISYEEYHPYGTTSYQAKSATINAVAKRYRYTGKERDDESGLNYHGARYYALWLCRWISVDPLEAKYAPQSPFAYCSNNPVNRVDPSGMGDYDKIKREIPQAAADNLSHGRLAPNAPTPVPLTPTTVRPMGVSSADNLRRQPAPQVATETVKTPVLGFVHQAAIGTTGKGQAALRPMSNRYVSPAEKWKNKQDQLKAFRAAGLNDDGSESEGHKFWAGPHGKGTTDALSFGLDGTTYIDLGFSITGLLRRIGSKAVVESAEVATRSTSIDPSKIRLATPMEGMDDVRMLYYDGKSLGDAALQQGGMILEIDIVIPAELQGKGLFKEVFKQLENEMNPIGFDATWMVNTSRYAETEGLSTNLKIFLENLPKMGQEGAAWSTPTGKVAKEVGYKKVNINIQTNNGQPHVTAQFSK